MEKVKFILLGNCRVGDAGEPTNLKDCKGADLFVGDIVVVSALGSYIFRLSVVCSDRWINYPRGDDGAKLGETTYFVMGIKTAEFMGENAGWIVQRVKKFEDAVPGEHWRDYGFKYA